MAVVKQAPALGPNPEAAPRSSDEGCVANIGPRERRKRLIGGIVGLGISLVLLTVLVVSGVSRWWRLPLFFLFTGATFGFFQWQEKTCVALAARKVRIMGEDVEKVEDASDLAQIQRQVSRVQLKAVLAAIALTLVALALP